MRGQYHRRMHFGVWVARRAGFPSLFRLNPLASPLRTTSLAKMKFLFTIFGRPAYQDGGNQRIIP
eukprot:6213322-Pleurochrysis_carterae.AAC.1